MSDTRGAKKSAPLLCRGASRCELLGASGRFSLSDAVIKLINANLVRQLECDLGDSEANLVDVIAVLIGNLNIGHSSRSQMTSQEERISGVVLLQSRVTRAWKLAIVARSFRYGEHGAWDEVRVIRARSSRSARDAHAQSMQMVRS